MILLPDHSGWNNVCGLRVLLMHVIVANIKQRHEKKMMRRKRDEQGLTLRCTKTQRIHGLASGNSH